MQLSCRGHPAHPPSSDDRTGAHSGVQPDTVSAGLLQRCCMELRPAVFRSCSACRTLPHVVLQSARRSPSQPLLQQLHWLPVRQRIDYKLAVLAYKIHHTSTRSTSAVTFSLSSSLVGFALLQRHESANRLPEPTSPTVLFRCSAPAVWNSLTADIVDSCSLPIFKRKLKTFLFRHAFSAS